MVTVDSKGRIVLPQDLRERLGITPGTEVNVREEDGKAVVDPEDRPEEVLADLEARIAEAARNQAAPSLEADDPFSQDHLDAIQRGAAKANDSTTETDEPDE